MGACLNQQPTVRVVIGPLLPIALVALELDDFADVLEGQGDIGAASELRRASSHWLPRWSVKFPQVWSGQNPPPR